MYRGREKGERMLRGEAQFLEKKERKKVIN